MAQVSIDIDPDDVPDDRSVSDECESRSKEFEFLTNNGMIKIQQGSQAYKAVGEWFVSGMGPLAMDTRVVAMHKNSISTFPAQARYRSFRIFSDAVAKKSGGQNAKVWTAWYGAPKNEIDEIVCYGFCRYRHGLANQQNFGFGLHLFPLKFSLDSVLSSEMDESGLRHVLLCDVILGKMEVVPAGSKQSHPSSKHYDSGVDNLEDPTRYIIWNCYTNSHISPVYVLSFKFPCTEALRFLKAPQGNANGSFLQSSSIHILMAILSRYSCRSKMLSFVKHLHDYENERITRTQLIENWSQLAGKKLFSAVLALYRKEVCQSAEVGPSRPRRDIPHA